MDLNYDLLNDTFGIWAIMDIAKACAGRMDDGCEDVSDELWRAMDDEIIYTEDQWALIAYYSEPSDPMTLAQAFDEFHADVMKCLDLDARDGE